MFGENLPREREREKEEISHLTWPQSGFQIQTSQWASEKCKFFPPIASFMTDPQAHILYHLTFTFKGAFPASTNIC